jgi:hypothetical protein
MTAAAGCSSLDPSVGPQNQCVAVDGPTDDSRYYAGGDAAAYAYGSGSTPVAPNGAVGGSCPVPAGSWCDDCESTNCCAFRLRCYADPSCAAADEVLDQCLEDAGADGGASSEGACFSAFLTQGGAIAQARVDCQQTCCPAACAVP